MPTAPLSSGESWEDDPAGNVHAAPGRMERRDVRAEAALGRRAVAKRPPPANPGEIYSNGMERVAYRLGVELGLPIPTTYLEQVGGEDSSLHARVPDARTWRQVTCAPMMASNIVNDGLLPLAVVFDIWMANTDRAERNILFEPIPVGSSPGKAQGSRFWLIDHGQCGLFPAWKWDGGRDPHDIPTDPADVQAELIPEAEKRIFDVMPPTYRESFKKLDVSARAPLLDAVRAVKDDAIDDAINEVPTAYFSPEQARTTATLLKERRNEIDNLVAKHW